MDRIYSRILGIFHLTTVSLVIAAMILNGSSTAWAVTKKKKMTINQAIHSYFLLGRSLMLPKLKKKIQKKTFHKGSFFSGEIPEIREIANDLKDVKFDVKSSKGFFLTAQRGEYKAFVEIEFVDPLAGKIRVGGQNIQLKRGMTYGEAAEIIAPAVLSPLLEKTKSKKTGLYHNPFGLFIQDAWGQGGEEYRYRRPSDLPPPYKRLLSRLTVKTVGVVASLGASAGALYATAASAGGMSAAANTALVGVVWGSGAALSSAGIAGAAASTSAAIVGGAITTGAAAMPPIAAGAAILLGVTVAGLFLIDTAILGLSKLDNLDRVGEDLNGLLDSCVEGKTDYYKQGSLEKIATFNGEKTRRLRGGDLEKFRVFRHIWTASNNLGQELESESGLACDDFVQKKGLDHIGEQFLSLLSERGKKESALNSLCKTHQAIIDCYTSVPSPYGEGGVSSQSVVNDRIIKEEDNHLWDFYQSLGGESIGN